MHPGEPGPARRHQKYRRGIDLDTPGIGPTRPPRWGYETGQPHASATDSADGRNARSPRWRQRGPWVTRTRLWRRDGHRHGLGYTTDRGHAPQRPEVDRAVCGRGLRQGPGAGACLAFPAGELAATVAELRSSGATVLDPVSEPWKTSATARCDGRTPATGPRTSEPMTAVALLPRRT